MLTGRITIVAISPMAVLSIYAQIYSPAGKRIKTKWAEEVSPDNVWKEYPRPQFQRETWTNLNGLWDYALQKKSGKPGDRDSGG